MSMTSQEQQVFSDALNTIEDMKLKLQQRANEKAVRTLLEEINTGFISTLKEVSSRLNDAVDALKKTAIENRVEKKDLLNAIEKISIEPKVSVTTPEIRNAQVSIPPIKIPEIVVPKPQVTVNVPKMDFPAYPKEMAVTGFAALLKSIADAFKSVFRVEVQQDRDTPLNVILCDDKGNHYKAVGGGSVAVGGGAGGGAPKVAEMLEQYKISDVDDSADPKYYGYLNRDGSWYIMRENTAAKTYRYCKGQADYLTAWTNRAAEITVYDYFDVIF